MNAETLHPCAVVWPFYSRGAAQSFETLAKQASGLKSRAWRMQALARDAGLKTGWFAADEEDAQNRYDIDTRNRTSSFRRFALTSTALLALVK